MFGELVRILRISIHVMTFVVEVPESLQNLVVEKGWAGGECQCCLCGFATPKKILQKRDDLLGYWE